MIEMTILRITVQLSVILIYASLCSADGGKGKATLPFNCSDTQIYHPDPLDFSCSCGTQRYYKCNAQSGKASGDWSIERLSCPENQVWNMESVKCVAGTCGNPGGGNGSTSPPFNCSETDIFHPDPFDFSCSCGTNKYYKCSKKPGDTTWSIERLGCPNKQVWNLKSQKCIDESCDGGNGTTGSLPVNCSEKQIFHPDPFDFSCSCGTNKYYKCSKKPGDSTWSIERLSCPAKQVWNLKSLKCIDESCVGGNGTTGVLPFNCSEKEIFHPDPFDFSCSCGTKRYYKCVKQPGSSSWTAERLSCHTAHVFNITSMKCIHESCNGTSTALPVNCSETQIFHPDPFDFSCSCGTKRYYKCVKQPGSSSWTAERLSCPTAHVFNITSMKCIHESCNGTSTALPVNCSEAQIFHPDPFDISCSCGTKRYYKCVKQPGSSSWTAERLSCPTAHVFNITSMKCIHESCNGTSTSLPVNCSETQIFHPDPFDLSCSCGTKKYYKCVKQPGSTTWSVERLACPDKQVWNMTCLKCISDSCDGKNVTSGSLPFTCSEEQIYHPDPFDFSCPGGTKKYYKCTKNHGNGTWSVERLTCPDDLVWNVDLLECAKDNCGNDTCGRLKCEGEDSPFSYPANCSCTRYFQQCSIVAGAKWYKVQGCPNGTIWNPGKKTCAEGTCEGKPTTPRPITTTSNPSHSAATASPYLTTAKPPNSTATATAVPPNPTTPAPPLEFKCERKGFFSNRKDCHSFHQCIKYSDGVIRMEDHTCPNGLVFSDIVKDCYVGHCNADAATSVLTTESKCPSTGLFADPRDCQSYYACYLGMSKGEYIPKYYRCEEPETAFSSFYQACHGWKYKECVASKKTSTEKSPVENKDVKDKEKPTTGNSGGKKGSTITKTEL